MINYVDIFDSGEKSLSVRNLYNETPIFAKKTLIKKEGLELFHDIKKSFLINDGCAKDWQKYNNIVNEIFILENDVNALLLKLKNKLDNKDFKKKINELKILCENYENVFLPSIIQYLKFLKSEKILESHIYVDPVDGYITVHYEKVNRFSNKTISITFTGRKKLNFTVVDRKDGLARIKGDFVVQNDNLNYKVNQIFAIF